MKEMSKETNWIHPRSPNGGVSDKFEETNAVGNESTSINNPSRGKAYMSHTWQSRKRDDTEEERSPFGFVRQPPTTKPKGDEKQAR